MKGYMKREIKESIDREVMNKALNNFQGEKFDMLDFILTKSMFKMAILEREGYTLEEYQNA